MMPPSSAVGAKPLRRQAAHWSIILPLPRGGTTLLFCGRVATIVTLGEEGGGGEVGTDMGTGAADEQGVRRARDWGWPGKKERGGMREMGPWGMP